MPKSADEVFARLADWVEGRLSEQEARAVEEQVAAADSATRADAAWLHAFAPISEDTVIAPLPPGVRDTLIEPFEAYAEGKARPGFLERLVATLRFDSDLQPAPGLRAASAVGSPRQLVYSTAAADVAIIVRPRTRDVLLDIYGQILPMESTESGIFGVQLLEGASEVATTATNELGEFKFEAVQPGVYEVLAGDDRVEIRVSQVELRREP